MRVGVGVGVGVRIRVRVRVRDRVRDIRGLGAQLAHAQQARLEGAVEQEEVLAEHLVRVRARVRVRCR